MSRPTYVRGEILPPLSQTTGVAERTSDDHLNLIATWLDDRFVVPGTAIRFGLDALIGWIPGIGDALAAFASLFIVLAGWKRGGADYANSHAFQPDVGGHVRRNTNHRRFRPCGLEGESPQLQLLIRDQQSRRRHTWQDWLFVIRCEPNDVPPVPRPAFAADSPVQVTSSALLSLTESL